MFVRKSGALPAQVLDEPVLPVLAGVAVRAQFDTSLGQALGAGASNGANPVNGAGSAAAAAVAESRPLSGQAASSSQPTQTSSVLAPASTYQQVCCYATLAGAPNVANIGGWHSGKYA